MWGNFGAAAGPYLFDYVLGEHPGLTQWQAMFLACGGAFLLSGVCALGIDSTKPVRAAEDEESTS
jgi:hypothetical protein